MQKKKNFYTYWKYQFIQKFAIIVKKKERNNF